MEKVPKLATYLSNDYVIYFAQASSFFLKGLTTKTYVLSVIVQWC